MKRGCWEVLLFWAALRSTVFDWLFWPCCPHALTRFLCVLCAAAWGRSRWTRLQRPRKAKRIITGSQTADWVGHNDSINTHTHPHLTALVPGLPRWASTRKVKTSLDFTEARDSEWQWHQLGHMQLSTSLQTDNHASTPPLCFYRPDALPAAQPTASKHWRHNDSINCRDNYQLWLG